MTGILDINLSIKGPQGVGKSRFMQRMLPILQESAEDFFEGCGCDLLVTGTESNVQDPKASLRWNMEQLRVHRAIRDEAQRNLIALLPEIGGTEEDVKLLERLREEQAAHEAKLDELSAQLLGEERVSFDE